MGRDASRIDSMHGRHRLRAGVCVSVLGALSACSLFVDVSGLSGGTSNDGGLDGASGGDGSIANDSSIEGNDGGTSNVLTPHALASVGNVPAESGNAQQQHLVFAINSVDWWIFYIDDVDTSVLKASVSTDFTTWVSAPTRALSEAMALEGRNFAAAYGNLGSKDVVHTFLSHFVANEDTRDSRAIITGAAIDYETGIAVSQVTTFNASVDPDGCNTAITNDGFVHDATGWDSEGNGFIGRINVFHSDLPDQGEGFDASFASNSAAIGTSGNPIQNRLLLPLKSGALLYLWPTAATTTATDNIAWASSASGTSTVSAAQNLFPSSTTPVEAMNDWNACEVGSTVHFVRRTLDGGADDAFDEMTFDGSTWSAGAPIPNDSGKNGSGLVLASDGTSLIAFTIASDAANSIRSTKLTGGVWSPWTTVVSSSATRNYLSASACGTTAHAGVIWTEGSAAPYSIMGVDVSGMF